MNLQSVNWYQDMLSLSGCVPSSGWRDDQWQECHNFSVVHCIRFYFFFRIRIFEINSAKLVQIWHRRVKLVFICPFIFKGSNQYIRGYIFKRAANELQAGSVNGTQEVALLGSSIDLMGWMAWLFLLQKIKCIGSLRVIGNKNVHTHVIRENRQLC